MLALEQVAGIMIWELGQDAFGTLSRYSLLAAIDYVVQNGELPVITGLQETILASNMQCYPNPFHDILTISANQPGTFVRVRVADLTGRTLILDEGYLSGGIRTVDASGLPAGAYVVNLEINGNSYRHVLIRN